LTILSDRVPVFSIGRQPQNKKRLHGGTVSAWPQASNAGKFYPSGIKDLLMGAVCLDWVFSIVVAQNSDEDGKG
jgi:hypothetical protein